MYSKDFVVAVLVNGKFCEEDKAGVIALPFGTEYTIRLRNKHSRRAVAKVFIDNENVTEDGIVVSGYGYVDLERSTTKAVKFKFVSSKSGEAIYHGKNNRTDGSNGVIRVEWRLEKEKPKPVYIPSRKYPWNYPHPYEPLLRSFGGGACGQSMTGPSESYAMNAAADDGGMLDFDGGVARSIPTSSAKNLAEGCTVEGGYSNQTFCTVEFEAEDGPAVVIQVVLKGYDITYAEHGLAQVKLSNKYCENCGKKTNVKAKFCSQCGGKL